MPRNRPLDPLDALLEDIRKARKPIDRLPETSPSAPEISQYANPDNWLPRGIIELVHVDSQGAETSLGFFREQSHRFSVSARRLQPVGLEPQTEVIRKELVHGAYWLYPSVAEPPEDSLLEVVALRLRFAELLEDFP